MSTAASSPRPDSRPQQLPLLDASDVPVQLRLDERTRRIGLAGIAMVRALLEEQRARRTAAPVSVPLGRTA